MRRRWWIAIAGGCVLLAGLILVLRGDRAKGGPFEPVTEGASALVLYDDAGEYRFLGELYGMMLANLAGRFGTVRTVPVGSYEAGEIGRHTATFYLGATYHEKPE